MPLWQHDRRHNASTRTLPRRVSGGMDWDRLNRIPARDRAEIPKRTERRLGGGQRCSGFRRPGHHGREPGRPRCRLRAPVAVLFLAVLSSHRPVPAGGRQHARRGSLRKTHHRWVHFLECGQPPKSPRRVSSPIGTAGDILIGRLQTKAAEQGFCEKVGWDIS